jgi:hypothetical protein
MGKDGIVLLIAIKKRPIFRRQRDCKIQDDIDGNSLGNRYWLSYAALIFVPLRQANCAGALGYVASVLH